MTRQRTVMLGAGALALTGLGYRAWDRGVFSGATGPAYAAWDEWYGRDLDGNHRALRAAILAASPHDTQPWLFAVSGNAIAVYADRRRHLGTFDPFRREMHLGVGCAIENLVRAAHPFGMTTEVQPENGRLEVSPGDQPVIAARVALGVGQPTPDPLFDAIPRRHTNRGAYRDVPIPPEHLHALTDLMSAPNLRVAFLTDDFARREMSAVIVKATERIIADPEMSMDSFRWIRTGRREVLAHRDGITMDTSGTNRMITIAGKILPNLNAAKTDQLWLDMTRDLHVATAPVLGMILVRNRLDMAQAITAGRAWQRLHLMATTQGIAAQPLNQPVEMTDRNLMLGRNDEFQSALTTLAGASGWEATFVFRIGYARRKAPRSPRRPLRDVITE